VEAWAPHTASLAVSLRLCWEAGIAAEFWPLMGDSYVWHARNHFADLFLNSKAKHLIFIDSDHGWDVMGFSNLLKAPGDVVGAAYPCNNMWDNWGVRHFTNEDKLRTPKVDPKTGLIEADTIPTGFMKISRRAFEQIIAHEPENYYWEGDSKVHGFFNHIHENNTMQGEDISFCIRCGRAGVKLWIEPNITISHYGIEPHIGNYFKFLCQQRGGSEWVKPRPNGKPFVSVVIPCFNYGHFIGEAIESVLKQSYGNVEIIVVNDGSTDNTSEVARKYGVTLIEQENQGVSAARNRGIRESHGGWVMCLDADDMLHPDYIDHCMEVDADIVSAGTQMIGDSNGTWLCPATVQYKDFFKRNCVNCSALFKKRVWEVTGGFDEKMRGGFEDYDLWWRAAKEGFKIAAVQEYLFYYRKHGLSMIDGANAKSHELLAYMSAKHGITLENGILHPDDKAAVIKEYAAGNGHRTLIETGTWHGDTIDRVKDYFDRIYSIEIGDDLYSMCKKKYEGDAHINLFHGNSAEVLPELLKNITSPCIFWLDAHHSAGDTCGAEVDIPIWDEIKAIREHPVKDHTILIDDMRGFSLSELTEHIMSFGEAKIENKDDILRVTFQ
jgi:glycosyltransferase involved in cell wall biosynthesis